MISWELQKPDAPSSRSLEEISELRGRVLYDNGRRPAFRLPSGQFSDADPLDPRAYHIIARNDGNPVGCVRNVPVTDGVTCLTERLLGERKFAEMFASFGVERKAAVESSRWMVHPEFRASSVGVLLAAGGVSVAKAFGFELLFCSVGTRDKQNRVLSRLGLRPVSGLPFIPVPEYDDELCVMYIQPQSPTPRFAEMMAEMEGQLNLRPPGNPDNQRQAELTTARFCI